MPTISLRMSEQQLEELREWARVGNRSMQREIIWRLFSAKAADAPKYAPATNEPRTAIEALADGTLSPPISSKPTADQEWLMRRAGKKKT